MINKAMVDIELKKARYENKFLITELDRHESEFVIKSNPAMFSEIFYERYVNNIYLDTVDLSSYQDNLMGRRRRLKVRIRWYGRKDSLIEKPMLELKIKCASLGTKKTYPLKSFTLDRNFSYEYLIRDVILKSNLPPWVVELAKSLNLASFNRYMRRYFISADRRYRITLDYGIEFYNIKQRNNTFLMGIRHDDRVIIELKYDKKHEHGAHNITTHFPFRLTKSSKYVSGIEVLQPQY